MLTNNARALCRYSTAAALPRVFTLQNLQSAATSCIQNSEVLLSGVRKLQKQSDLHAVIPTLDAVSNSLCSLIDYAEAATRLKPGTALAEDAGRASQKVFQYMTGLNADQSIYTSLMECLELDRKDNFLCEEGKRVAQALGKDFEASGITFSAEKRAELRKMQTKLQNLGADFEAANADPLSLLLELVQQRGAFARLLGFKSYSEFALKDHVLSSTGSVDTFLASLTPRSAPVGWGYNSKTDQPTGLDVKQCLQLLNPICSRYFNVQFDIKLVEIWDARWWRLHFTDNTTREGSGEVYLRADHRLTNCHFVLRTWRQQRTKNIVYDTKGVQRPISMVSVNVCDPQSLKFNEIQSLFHEFGHALHSICARTKFHHLSGTRCTLDFAEVPSNLMEQVLLNAKGIFSKNIKDPRLLSRFEAWQRSVAEGEQVSLVRQLALAKLDQFLHSPALAECRDIDRFKELLSLWTHENVSAFSERRVLLGGISSFRHLVTYGSSYYCYLFSQHLAKEIWSRYLDYGSQSHSPLRFYHGALKHGGTKTTAEILAELGIDVEDLINQ